MLPHLSNIEISPFFSLLYLWVPDIVIWIDLFSSVGIFNLSLPMEAGLSRTFP